MKLFNRLETRLAILIALVVVFTNLIMYGLASYNNQRNFKDLPRDVQDYLQLNNSPPMPMQVSKQIQSFLYNGSKVTISSETPVGTANQQIYLLQPSGLVNTEPLRMVVDTSAFHRERPSFRARLEQSLLWTTLLSAALGIALAWLFAHRVARPLEAVSNATTQLAGGNLKVRIPNPKGQDETANLARNFNHMAESLEKLETERKAMIADIAHELRTPLTVIQARLEAIQDGVTSLDMSEIDRLHRQTGLLSRLIEDLRTLSLADAGKLSLERRDMDVGQMVASVVESFQAEAQAKKVHLEADAPRPLRVNADPYRLTQVLSNLVTNALKYTPENGSITVKAIQQDKQVTIQIQDTGSGLPTEAIHQLFDRFYRVEGSRSRQSGGSGLGLAIVKTLVELHGGKVEAHNRPQGGAEFRISLPLQA